MERKGIIVRVAGVVVDVEFASGNLPSIHNALRIEGDDGWRASLIVEVQEHVDARTVRCIAMGSTSGLRRGLPVRDEGHPIRVPVGPPTLGRMFNVLGQPIDGRPLDDDVERHSIHPRSPPLRERRVVTEPFVTGVKAIDLLTPYPVGGKIGLFGGAGVDKRDDVDTVLSMIREYCHREVEVGAQEEEEGIEGASRPVTTHLGGAAVFVWELDRIEIYGS